MGLIMLDMDGTLVQSALVDLGTQEKKKLGRMQHELYTEPELMPNVYETLKRHADEGDAFAIVTNQGGVAWGYHTQAEVYRRISNTTALLSCFWGRPFSVHVAFMDPRGTVPGFKGDDGRKPSGLMLEWAMEAAGQSPRGTAGQAEASRAASLMVGDRDEDREAAEFAKVPFSLAGDFFGW
jgi:histidinol phosphatase-like enzyme